MSEGTHRTQLLNIATNGSGFNAPRAPALRAASTCARGAANIALDRTRPRVGATTFVNVSAMMLRALSATEHTKQ